MCFWRCLWYSAPVAAIVLVTSGTPAKAKPRRPAPAQVRQRLPVSLIWSPRGAAALTASKSLAWSDPRPEPSFDVGLY